MKLEQVAQELVDVAQRSGSESEAVFALARSARWWLARVERDEAASLFAVAMVLGAISAEVEFDPAVGAPPISEQRCTIDADAGNVHGARRRREARTGSEEFYEQVFTTLDEQYEGIGYHLRFVLDTARNAMAQTRDDHDSGGSALACYAPGLLVSHNYHRVVRRPSPDDRAAKKRRACWPHGRPL